MMAGNVKGIWIGVDVGTTGVRAIAYEASGVSLASAEAFYPLRTPHPDWAEERPSEILAATEQVVREAADALRYQERMPSGIALSTVAEAEAVEYHNHGWLFFDVHIWPPCFVHYGFNYNKDSDIIKCSRYETNVRILWSGTKNRLKLYIRRGKICS